MVVQRPEIDLVALDPAEKRIMFIECKWSTLGNRELEEIIADLKHKTKDLRWKNKEREETFGIIARTIENKSEWKKRGY